MYIEDKKERFILARWTYLMGEPIISDIEYDALEKEYKSLYPEDEYSLHGWAFDECPAELLKKYNLTELIYEPVMGYMAESIASLNTYAEVAAIFGNLEKKSRVSFKIDGWNTRVSYFNGHLVKVETRGRSGTSLDARTLAPLFPSRIPIKGRVAVTGETNIPHSKWAMFKLKTGNTDQRASVRTALATGATEYLSFLAFNIFIENGKDRDDDYAVLKELGFTTPKFKFVNDYSQLQKCIEYMSMMSKGYDHLTDGLVIENDEYQYAIRLGEWEEHSMYSYIEGYEENPGMYGVAMNVLIKPIEIEGRTYPRVSVTNLACIMENRLEIGAPIAFALRSSANVVIDVTETRRIQNIWAGKYDKYRESIDNS